jgi:hypothetical protein
VTHGVGRVDRTDGSRIASTRDPEAARYIIAPPVVASAAPSSCCNEKIDV